MFNNAWSTKGRFPIEFYAEEDFLPKEEFKEVCSKYGIAVKVFPNNSLSLIVDEIKNGFEAHFDNRQAV